MDNDILDVCKTNGIVVQAYSPLGCGTGVSVREMEGNIDRGRSIWLWSSLSDKIIVKIPNQFEYKAL